MMEYEFHPIANVFPLLDEQGLADLAADILERDLRERGKGVLVPIVLFEGKILDGRNRYLACRRLGTDITAVETYTGVDPIGEVISLNLQRRHLSESQRALVAAKIATLHEGAPPGNRNASKTTVSIDTVVSSPRNVTHEQSARMLNVGEATVKRASVIRKRGSPNVISAVERGEVTVNAAYAAVKDTPKSAQETWTPDDIKIAAKAAAPPRHRDIKRVDPSPSPQTTVIRPNGCLLFCQFLLSRITEPDDIKELRARILSTWIPALKEAFDQALAERHIGEPPAIGGSKYVN